MAQYHVCQLRERIISLRDSAGRHHLARALHEVPGMGAEMHGTRPERGFAILSEALSGRPFRVVFEVVNCAKGDLFEHSPTN